MSNKPLILTDNLFDNVVLHPTFAVASYTGMDTSGHEAYRVADNLRDLSWWTVGGLNTTDHVHADCLTNQSPNVCVLDRGHNLAGKVVSVSAYTDLTFATTTFSMSATIPSTAGGLPSDANGCVTPDGVWWKTFTPVAGRVWALSTPTMGVGIAPLITGLYLGTSYRFTEYLNAPAAYDYGTSVKYLRNEFSRGGVRAKSRGINQDKLSLSVHLESTDYAGFDTEVRRMLRYNAPMWFALDDSDSTGVGQMRMFQLAGDLVYDPQVNPVHREIRVELEEAVPSLYT